jgi:hypothetical protein
MTDKLLEGPCPGQYDPSFTQILKRDPTTKIKENYNKERKIESAGLPGPGYYETNKSTLNKTAFSLGLKLDKSRKGSPVGPGAYDPKFDFDSTKATNVAPRFPNEQRNKEIVNNQPAPG